MSLNFRTYTIRANDTIQRIAFQNQCDWKDIVAINNLEPPYIVPEDFQREGYAEGFARLTWSSLSNLPEAIPASTPLRAYVVGREIRFYTKKDTPIPHTQYTVDIPIIAEAPGSMYNLPDGSELSFLDHTLNAAFSSITSYSLSGGFVKRVKKPGESIYIPTTDSPETPDLIRAYGVDLALEGRELRLGDHHDIVLAGGVDNLVASLSRRITTRKGSYLLHPEYGSNLHFYLGKAIFPGIEKALEMEVREAIFQDVRVKDVTGVSITFKGDTILISCTVVARTDLVFPLEVVVSVA